MVPVARSSEVPTVSCLRMDTRDFSPNRFILPALFVAIALAALISLIAEANRNPDEFHHLAAVHYYITHFFPPTIGDPEVRDAYSVWGTSYLDFQWLEYFLAGKFIWLFRSLAGSELLAARFFNVALFAGMVIFFAVRSRTDRNALIIPALFLITPQVWYIFGYFNNDAFALFVAALLGYQIVSPTSAANNYLNNRRLFGYGAIWFGLLVGTLLICKSNYWIFLAFAGISLVLKRHLSIELTSKFAVIGLLALTVLGARIGLDLYANGETNFVGVSYISFLCTGTLRGGSRLRALQEEIAQPPFKASTLENDPDGTDPSVNLRAKGVGITELFSKWKFHTQSFKSFVGVYGYMDKTAASLYYASFAGLYLFFGGYLVFSVARSRDTDVLIQFFLLAAGVFATFLIALLLSWTFAFQAQGRYLFPLIPMLGVFVYTNRRLLSGRYINIFLSAAFLLSLYSFIFVGILRINE